MGPIAYWLASWQSTLLCLTSPLPSCSRMACKGGASDVPSKVVRALTLHGKFMLCLAKQMHALGADPGTEPVMVVLQADATNIFACETSVVHSTVVQVVLTMHHLTCLGLVVALDDDDNLELLDNPLES